MCQSDELFIRDMEWISKASFIPWESLKGCRILVTGATGLVGYTLVSALLYANSARRLGMTILALVRDKSRAVERFSSVIHRLSDTQPRGEAPQTDCDRLPLKFIEGSMEKFPIIDEPVDYIVHGASQTASRAFIRQPVETIRTAVMGTAKVLELAKEKRVMGMVYLSSMEMYGHPVRGHKVTEDEAGVLSPLEIRNSYPISKLQCESLCNAYAAEYGVPVKTVRLTQTFGPGVNYGDQRVFAEFARCVLEKRDIVLKTKGETERCYLYTADAASAILTVLLKGESGQAYNAADERTYCSIAEMAELVAKMGGVQVKFDLESNGKTGFPDVIYMDLDTKHLIDLGWYPQFTPPPYT